MLSDESPPVEGLESPRGRTGVLPWKYWSTTVEVLEFYRGSTGVPPWRYWSFTVEVLESLCGVVYSMKYSIS